MKSQKITIITSVYSASDDFLLRQSKEVKLQSYSGRIEHIFINDNIKRPRKIKGLRIINNKENLGLSGTLNKGFRMAKTNIVISLMDDCLPTSKNWINNLIEPILNDYNVAATTSDVEMPLSLWRKFDFFSKAMTEKEIGPYTPGIDEKGCAYNARALKEIGYLDEKNFKNGGEDTDFTIKIEKSKKWKLIHTKAKVYHFHFANSKSRITKEIQYALLSGLVSRKYYFDLPWDFEINVALKTISFIWLLISLFFPIGIVYPLIVILLISNFRLPSQIRKLWPDGRIIILPALNLMVYFAYVICYLFAIIFKPRV